MRKLLIIISLLSLTSNPLYAKRLSSEKTQLYKNKLDYIKYGVGLSSGTLETDVLDANEGALKKWLGVTAGRMNLPRYDITPLGLPIGTVAAMMPRLVRKLIPISATSSDYHGLFIFIEGLLPNYLFGLRVQASLNRMILNSHRYRSVAAYFNFTDIQLRWYFGNDKNWVLYGALRFLSFLSSYDHTLERVDDELKMLVPGTYFGLEREGNSGFAMGITLFGGTSDGIKILTEEEELVNEKDNLAIYFPVSYSEIYISYNIAKPFYSLDVPGRWGYLVPRSSRALDTFDDYMKFGFHLGPSFGLINYQKVEYLYTGNGIGADISGFGEYRFAKKYLGVRLGLTAMYSKLTDAVNTKYEFLEEQKYSGIKPMIEYTTRHMIQARGELLLRIYPDQYSDACLFLGPYVGFLINKKGPLVEVDEEGEEEVDEQSEEVIAEYPSPLIDFKRWNFGLTVGADYEFKGGFILGYKLSMTPFSPIECVGNRSKDHYSHSSVYLGYNFSKLIDLYSL